MTWPTSRGEAPTLDRSLLSRRSFSIIRVKLRKMTDSRNEVRSSVI